MPYLFFDTRIQAGCTAGAAFAVSKLFFRRRIYHETKNDQKPFSIKNGICAENFYLPGIAMAASAIC